MDPKTRVKDDLKEAMKARDMAKVSTIRMLQAELQKREIDKRAPLDQEEFLRLVATLIKQRKESAEAFVNGGRQELADKENAEIAVLQGYLPPQMNEAELAAIVDAAIAETGATSAKEIGKVMQAVLPKVAGRADGKTVNQLVRSKLTG